MIKPALCLLILLLSGCQGKLQQRHSFPAVWPEGVGRLAWADSISAGPAAPGPSVWVGTIAVDPEDAPTARGELLPAGRQGAEPRTGKPASTSETLRELLIEKLRQVGVQVSDRNSRYALTGVVPRLGFTTRSGYPRKLIYTSEVAYQVVDRQTGAIVADRSLQQEIEQTVLVNTMTKLPEDPNAPEQELFKRCLEPALEMVAASVKEELERRHAAAD